MSQHLYPAVVVAGPTGSGKTSLVKRLAPHLTAYLEQAEQNPHLAARFHGRFDALESQRWFLEQMGTFFRRHEHHVIAVDQHLFAVSRVYGVMFHERGLLSRRNLESLHREAEELWAYAVSSRSTILTICLTARTTVLNARIQRRSTRGLKPAEIGLVNRLFSSLVFPGPCLLVNTEVVSLNTEFELVTEWLSTKTKQPKITDAAWAASGPRYRGSHAPSR